MQIEQRIANDLAASGLAVGDIGARPSSASEKAATSVPYSVMGYTIPYSNIYGTAAPFYRVKLFDFDPKYKQPKETPNHVYYPKGFYRLAQKMDYVLITEGEKKAALAVKLGFPCIAFGGVDSWRNRIFSLPANAELNSDKKRIQAKVSSGEEAIEDHMSPLALGMQELIDFAIENDKKIVIVYDTDVEGRVNFNVQRAAATLAFELRFRGIAFKNIRQIVLPLVDETEKSSLDDYLLSPAGGQDSFQKLLDKCLKRTSAFPRHPNIRDYLNKRLQKQKMSRKEMQQVSIAILSELDACGMRLRSDQELQSYFFDVGTHKLMKAIFSGQPAELSESVFGQFLYKKFGIGAADWRVVQWLGTLFNGEEPISNVSPNRVFARPNINADNVIMQISDGSYAVVDKNGLTIKANGTDGILFESDQVQPIDVKKLAEEFTKQSKEERTPNWWAEVMTEVRLKDRTQQRQLTALLFYISPWLYRWRGSQLPIEMTLGEAGSGKSTLQELRLMIQTGDPKLRNSPQDIKDWHASVANSGGLHITDNVQLLDKNLRQRLSDEICRLITEPTPTVEMRKYYTNADLVRIPVRCVFGITAISQPFLNSDILQRSVIVEMDKAQDLVDGFISYNMVWKEQQLNKYGGREAWLAHHFLVLHRFFKMVEKSWDPRYSAKHRLINFEQSMIMMCKVFGMPYEWIPGYLMNSTDKAITESDLAFEGLGIFAQYWVRNNPEGMFTCQEITNWAMGTEDYEKCEILINSRKLGKYIKTHKTMIASSTGMVEAGMTNNRQRYRIEIRKPRSNAGSVVNPQ